MKLHSKKDIYYYYKTIFLSLLPLILFGIIKNGLYLYKETTNIYIILKPIIFLGINLVIGLIADLIVNKRFKINRFLVYLIILYMISSINTPLWLYLIGDILLVVFLYFDKGIINKIALTSLLIYGGNLFINSVSYKNLVEASGKYVFSFIDMIFVRQVGGIATSNLILVILLFIFLLFNIFYKRNISLFGLLIYIVFFSLMAIIYNSNLYINYLINSTIIFEIIMIAPINQYSPYNPKGEIIYGLLIGLIACLLCCFIDLYAGVLITIVLLSPFRFILEKIKILS